MWKWGMMKYYPAKYLRWMFTMDPTKPKVVSSHPSPAHLEAIDELNSRHSCEVTAYSKQQRFANLKYSQGSYMTDLDGNVVLDLNAAQSGMPLGYNNIELVTARMG